MTRTQSFGRWGFAFALASASVLTNAGTAYAQFAPGAPASAERQCASSVGPDGKLVTGSCGGATTPAPAATAPGTCIMQPLGDGRFALTGCAGFTPTASAVDTNGLPDQVMMDFNERTGPMVMTARDAIRAKMSQGYSHTEARDYVGWMASSNAQMCSNLERSRRKQKNAAPLRYFLYGLGLAGGFVASSGLSTTARLGYTGMAATTFALNEVNVSQWNFDRSIWRDDFQAWCGSMNYHEVRTKKYDQSFTAWQAKTKIGR